MWLDCHPIWWSPDSREGYGELPELVIIMVMKRSPYLVKIRVTILSLFVSPNMVIFGGICRNWWKLRWWNYHQILWQFMWRFCHFLFHPIWWFFGRSARNGENWSDEEITTFGDNLCDDFVTFCFTQNGEFLGDLPELVYLVGLS